VIAPTPRPITPQADLFADIELEQRVLEGFHRTGYVTLDDEEQFPRARPALNAWSRSRA